MSSLPKGIFQRKNTEKMCKMPRSNSKYCTNDNNFFFWNELLSFYDNVEKNKFQLNLI